MPHTVQEAYAEHEEYKEGKITLAGKTYQCVIGGDKAYKGLRVPLGWKSLVTMTAANHDIEEEVCVCVCMCARPLSSTSAASVMLDITSSFFFATHGISL